MSSHAMTGVLVSLRGAGISRGLLPCFIHVYPEIEMDTRTRALRLLSTPNYAPIIQIAALNRQALGADQVAVLSNKFTAENRVGVLWIDGHGCDVSTSTRIPIEKVFQACASARGVDRTRFIQGGYIWKEEDLKTNEVQIIGWHCRYNDRDYVFLWLKLQKPYFNANQRNDCNALCGAASKLLGGQWYRQQRNRSFTESEGNSGAVGNVDLLSPTERMVAVKLREGLTEREIADALHRSPNTIHVHVRNIYRKLLVNSRQELVRQLRISDQ
jgi:DNA-binding CsgD family transcriptional regulator